MIYLHTGLGAAPPSSPQVIPPPTTCPAGLQKPPCPTGTHQSEFNKTTGCIRCSPGPSPCPAGTIHEGTKAVVQPDGKVIEVPNCVAPQGPAPTPVPRALVIGGVALLAYWLLR